MKFLSSINDDEYEEVILYNELMGYLQWNEDIVWKFCCIVGHQGPL